MRGRIQPTSRIGSKSIEITLPIKGHTISVNLHPIQIRPVEFDRA